MRLWFLSCLARDKSVYIASNLATKSCNAETGCKLWNTEVVFNSKGYIVATYRKSHVYGSTPRFDAPNQNDQDVAWFSIGGLKIGLLVCFDLEFLEPANKLIRSIDVDAVLMSMFWVNTPPISWSILYQQAWSLRHEGVTLIAVNDGNSVQTWGNGAYHNGWLVSNQEAFTADKEKTGKYGEFQEITWIALPERGHMSKGMVKKGSNNKEKATEEENSPPFGAVSETSSFPCLIPNYGQGACVHFPATSSNESHIVTVHHNKTHCRARVTSPFDQNLDGGRLLVAALDVELRDPGPTLLSTF